ncbi:sensor histidine kinase [Thermomonospora umbrina]|nr:HAMP domain-containing sensor histidine kinase [Thermomonospora umbrina]
MTLLACSVMALACLLVSVLVVIGVRGRATDYARDRTGKEALKVLHLVKTDRLPPVLDVENDIAVQVLDPRGHVVAATPDLLGKAPMAHVVPGPDNPLTTRRLCPPEGLDGCMDIVAFRVYQPDGHWMIYAADDAVPWYVSGSMVTFLLAMTLLLVLLTALGASRTVSRTLAPVGAIRAELAEITASDTGRRVPVPENRDEIRLLAETVNATLQRLDAALAQMRRFTSDASHDLRSPITAARTQVEEAMLYPDETDWPATARKVLASLDRLQAIVTDLLELAAMDAGAKKSDECVDLAALVSAELRRQTRRVPVHTELTGGTTVNGDPLRLSRLVVNLIDNAERHAATAVTVIVRKDGPTAVLEVRDDGAGIPPHHRETVFQRFTRLDAARSRDAGGTGLGLPIARQTAEAHGGTLTVEDSPRGARLVLRLPLSPKATRPPR